jgi:multidrug resistance efflux pump
VPTPPSDRQPPRRRGLPIGVLGVLVLAAAVAFGTPQIRLALNTVSTDDAFVSGHMTLVAARVRSQIARVLVDDNNRVHEGDLPVELDKEPTAPARTAAAPRHPSWQAPSSASYRHSPADPAVCSSRWR